MKPRVTALQAADADGALLPFELLPAHGEDSATAAERHRGRREWFRTRDVPAGREQLVIIRDSGRAYGIPTSTLDREWVGWVGLDAWRRAVVARNGEGDR